MEEYTRKPNTKCRVCSKPIYRRPCEIKRSLDGLFCGHPCYGIAQRKEHPCVVCGKPILSGAHKKTCSRNCSNVNRAGIKYKVGRPKDKVNTQAALKIRLIKERGPRCQRCEYTLVEILQVHHRDRNRKNNHLKNLELLCPNCHAKEHYLKNA